ncbi:uncharacterized protein LOC128218346 [Mya arenaria]|uniref:uncharacterized protein LOC128218346 n=1 Tax=Mya arenaria TaxID=6604 RepID=UPI0022E35A91|nr:uncharacterized protein LOC128218346 [Mya arenaria]XP_052781956.1 uncharacterized protein LOC128218346 [Mya arenaria]
MRHVIPTYRVYPRVHYFQKRFTSLYPGFRRVVGAFPDAFHDKVMLSQMETLYTLFRMTLEVTVTGTESLQYEDYLVDPSPLENESWAAIGAPGVRVQICCVRGDTADNVIKNLDVVLSEVRGKDTFLASTFIAISIDQSPSSHEGIRIMQMAYEHLRDQGWNTDHYLTFGVGIELASRISDHLERQLIGGFRQIYDYLGRFVNCDRRQPNPETIEEFAKKVELNNLITSFLYDAFGAGDETKQTLETEVENPDEQNKSNLAKLFKCTLIRSYLAQKFPSVYKIVDTLMTENQIETRVAGSISNKCYEFIKHAIQQCQSRDFSQLKERRAKKRKGTVKHYLKPVSYKWLVWKVLGDISKVIHDVEQSCRAAQRFIISMEKMMFEIEVCMEQTITEKFEAQLEKCPEVPEQIRAELLRLKSVYSIGTIYNDFVINIKSEQLQREGQPPGAHGQPPEAHGQPPGAHGQPPGALGQPEGSGKPVQGKQEPMDVDPWSVSNILNSSDYYRKAVEEIRFVMRGCGPHVRWTMQVVSQTFTPYVRIQYEHGRAIFPKNEWRNQGTLGCFVMSSDSKLYALSCAHVVDSDDPERRVWIPDIKGRLRVLGTWVSDLTVTSGSVENLPLIDFAAVKIEDDLQQDCTRHLRDEDGINCRSTFYDGPHVSLRGKQVFKYGSGSGMTSGIVVSTDLCLSGPNASEQYLVIVDCEQGRADQQPFAVPGDSGAVVCMQRMVSNVVYRDSNEPRLFVLSMINAGGMKIHGDEDDNGQILSFCFKRGIDSLTNHDRHTFNNIAFELA